MAYQSLYRRYRPQRFAEVRGQEHLVRALQNAVRENRVGHAYLFSGPRGTGKTSTARILAKVLNCEKPVDGEPCGVCDACVAIEQGTSFDVHELDAASNNKVEDIRELVNKASLGTPGRTKVYILDEVHMLTAAASNALLKTLEEPPDHVVFVLATTDPQKVLPTIRSRCQHFEVHLLPADELESLARYIIEDAGLEVPPEAVDYVVRAGAGSARDMESALDQVVAAGGIPDDGDALDELVEALCDRDTGRSLVAVELATNSGRSPRVLGEQLIARLRDVFLASVGADLSRLPDRDRARVTDQAARLTASGSTRALEVLGDAFVGIQDAPDPRIPLEVALVRLTRPEAELSLAALADRIGRLERGGGVPAPQGSGSVSARSTSPAGERPTTPAVAAESAPPAAQASTSSPPATPPPASGPRPADSAREALAQRKQAAERAAPAKAPAKPPAAKAAKAPTAQPEPGPVEPSAPSTPPAASTSSPAATAGALPTHDELTLAWSDSILASLANKARSRCMAGRFVSVDADAAVFGLPNVHHARRCEEVVPEVEQALAAHFGRPVPLRIVVDEGATPPDVHDEASTVAEAEPDDEVDVTQLTDATDVAESNVERVAQVFPGVELVEEN